MIGLVDVDGGKFPNYALMKVARYYRDQGEDVEWAMRREIWRSCEFKDFSPRKGFQCIEYIEDENKD